MMDRYCLTEEFNRSEKFGLKRRKAQLFHFFWVSAPAQCRWYRVVLHVN